jgi:mRNA interferase RelE/StbE
MASYSIVIEAKAEKSLRQLSVEARRRVVKAIDGLAENPYPLASRKMVGYDCVRLRVGDYRVIYRVNGQILEIYVIEIGHRREIYR